MYNRSQSLKTASESQLSLFPEAKNENVAAEALYQYLLVISPPEHLKAKVRSLKHKLNDAIGLSNYNMHSVPHISIISFHTLRPVNERFIEAVQNIFLKHDDLSVRLNGFSHFSHASGSNTIYVDIQNSEPIASIHSEL